MLSPKFSVEPISIFQGPNRSIRPQKTRSLEALYWISPRPGETVPKGRGLHCAIHTFSLENLRNPKAGPAIAAMPEPSVPPVVSHQQVAILSPIPHDLVVPPQAQQLLHRYHPLVYPLTTELTLTLMFLLLGNRPRGITMILRSCHPILFLRLMPPNLIFPRLITAPEIQTSQGGQT